MRKDRLLKLSDFLEKNVDNEHFDLEYIKRDTECGSVCCALGWMPICFPDGGISYNFAPNNVMMWDRDGYHVCDYGVGEEFFDITWHQSLYLFGPQYYPKSKRSRKYVVNRIRNFVKRGGIHPSHELY